MCETLRAELDAERARRRQLEAALDTLALACLESDDFNDPRGDIDNYAALVQATDALANLPTSLPAKGDRR